MLTEKINVILAILFLNLVKSPISKLPVDVYAKGTVFATQIQPGKETAPEGGSNLNVVGNTEQNPEQDHLANFLFTIRPLENKDKKKYDTPKEVTIKENEYIKPLPLVSDNCLELLFRNFTDEINKYKLKYDRVKDYDTAENLINIGISKKRDVTDIYSSINNDDVKIESRKQQKQDTAITKKTSTVSIATTKILKSNEINILNNATESLNTTLQVTVTENILNAGYTEEAWSETKDKSKIRFNKLPQRENYLIPTLKLEEGFYPFSFMSEFFNLIYPFDFPTGKSKILISFKFHYFYKLFSLDINLQILYIKNYVCLSRINLKTTGLFLLLYIDSRGKGVLNIFRRLKL